MKSKFLMAVVFSLFLFSPISSFGGEGPEVPEIDAGAAGIAFFLVIGTIALIRERKRRK